MTTDREALVNRLRERARIRRQIPTRKSVQAGEPDRIADLLDEAADALTAQSGGQSASPQGNIILALEEFRDVVLNQRGALAENQMSNDQVNDVLGEFDSILGPFMEQSADTVRVPREATPEMILAGMEAFNNRLGTVMTRYGYIWEAMLAAAKEGKK